MKEPQGMTVTGSITLKDLTGSHVMVDVQQAYKNVYIWTAKYQTFFYINFIKIGRGNRIGQSVARPLPD